jgi:hypothetical protein
LAAVRVAPETLPAFRAGQLLLLLVAARTEVQVPIGIDRLGYFEFFSANPFLVVDPRSRDGLRLLAAGFDFRNLDYQSSSQRFTNRRARLQRDLATLTALGLVTGVVSAGRLGYQATDAGVEAAAGLRAMYAVAFRTSASIVLGRLKRLSDTRLREDAAAWLHADELLVDLYDA